MMLAHSNSAMVISYENMECVCMKRVGVGGAAGREPSSFLLKS